MLRKAYCPAIVQETQPNYPDVWAHEGGGAAAFPAAPYAC